MDPLVLAADLPALLKKVTEAAASSTDEPLRAVGLTGMAEAGFLANGRNEPLTPILLWYDRRGADEAEELRQDHEDALTSVSGIRMSNVATIYKLAYLKKHYPEYFTSDVQWFGVPEWAAYILTGKKYTDRTLAVRTGAYSLSDNSWSSGVLDIFGLDPQIFPDIIPVPLQNAVLAPDMSAFAGIKDPVRVVVAGHDDLAAAYGAGASFGSRVDSTGTAEGLVALTSTLPDPRLTVRNRMSIAPWYVPEQWALVAGVGTSGSLLAELRNQTGLDFEVIDDFAKNHAVYPENALQTELTPARIAKVSFAEGLTAEQKISAVYDRILENFSQRAHQLMKFAEKPERLVVTGGHALLPELTRRKSEALGGIPVIARPKPEAAAYGAASLSVLCP